MYINLGHATPRICIFGIGNESSDFIGYMIHVRTNRRTVVLGDDQ